MFSQAIATNETSSYDCTLDGLVRICANIVARIVVVSLDTGCGTTPDGLPRQSVPIEVIESIIFIALYSIARWIVNQKNQRGGWAPWLGSMLRGLIVADERQRHWTGPTFDIMEGQITPRLICPITLSLVCVLSSIYAFTTVGSLLITVFLLLLFFKTNFIFPLFDF